MIVFAIIGIVSVTGWVLTLLWIAIRYISYLINRKRFRVEFLFKRPYVSPIIDTSNLFIVKSAETRKK